ncbi:MAG: hypothetical protein EPO22_03655 [Dehalococcoidia bacterium]|nr:MAG: hypothetical protein EPO22_03655 [Dehalococcoidia bacterium]
MVQPVAGGGPGVNVGDGVNVGVWVAVFVGVGVLVAVPVGGEPQETVPETNVVGMSAAKVSNSELPR